MSLRRTRGTVPAGTRVLVTGAAGGFGAPTVARLREQGARVVGLDRSAGDGVLACDITDPQAVERAVAEAVRTLGGLDAVVHYAGIGIPNDAGGPLEPDALKVIDTNLLGAWRVTSAALPALLDGPGRGRVVFVASELAYVTLPFLSAYSVAKRGMSAYADALRLEYGPARDGTGLHVTTVYPGYVRTPIHEAGREVGLSLEGQVRREEVEDIVRTVVGALAAPRPPRDTAGTLAGQAELWVGRHAPGLLGRGVVRRIRQQAAAGRFDSSPVAAGLIRRFTGRTVPAVTADRTPERSAS